MSIPFPFSLKERSHIPKVMGTEHPDNATPARFLDPPRAKIMVNDEIEEFHYMFKKLEMDEVMLDAEGKAAEATPVMKLLPLDMAFYKKNTLGKDLFITFRVPNTEHRKDYRLPNAFQTILTSTRFMQGEFNLKQPPLLEVLLPMTVDGHQPFRVLKQFHETAVSEHKIWNDASESQDFVGVIPLVEEPKYMINYKNLLYEYISDIKNEYGFQPDYLRTMIARSDPAMLGGLISATLGAKIALSENYLFEKETGIKVFPIIGAGTLLNRGSYSPDRVDEFFETYPGTKTITAQSAFRYDYDEKLVKKGIERSKVLIDKSKPVIYSEEEKTIIAKIIDKSEREYRKHMTPLIPMIVEFAKFVPMNRERLLHIGFLSYGRKIRGKKETLPRAISFTSVFYTAGIPPEFIGVPETISSLTGNEKKMLFRAYPNFLEQLKHAAPYFSYENLHILSNKWPHLKRLADSIRKFSAENKIRLGPSTSEQILHRNHISNAAQYYLLGKHDLFAKALVKAGMNRKALG